jgi:hypothetical protein
MKKAVLGSVVGALLAFAAFQSKANAGLWDWIMSFFGFDPAKPGYFQVWQSDKNQEWYFHLKAANNKIILQSEGYKAFDGAKNGMISLLRNASTLQADILQSKDGKSWYFVWKAENYKVIGASEMYTRRSKAEGGAQAVGKVLRNNPRVFGRHPKTGKWVPIKL